MAAWLDNAEFEPVDQTTGWLSEAEFESNELPESTIGEDLGDLATKFGSGGLDLLAAGADILQPDPRPPGVFGIEQAAAGISTGVGSFFDIDFLKEFGEKKGAEIAEQYATENARRAVAGEPSLEEERLGQIGTRGAEFFSGAGKKLSEIGLSDRQKALDKKLGEAIKGGAWDTAGFIAENPSIALSTFAESLPMMLFGAGIGRIGKVVAGRKGGITGSIAGEAGTASALNARQAQDVIMQIPDDELIQLPEAQIILDANPDAGIETIRSVLMDRSSNTTFAASLMSNVLVLGASQGLGANVVQDVFAGVRKKTADGIIKRGVKGVVGESAQEFVQEAGDSIAGDLGAVASGALAAEDIGGEALASGVLGAAAGGPAGGVTNIISGKETDDVPPPDAGEELELDKIAERVLAENPDLEPIDLMQDLNALIDQGREELAEEQKPVKELEPEQLPEPVKAIEPEIIEAEEQKRVIEKPVLKIVQPVQDSPVSANEGIAELPPSVSEKDIAPVEQPLEESTDADRLRNLKDEKEAQRKGLDKPLVPAQEGAGGLFIEDDAAAPGDVDVQSQQELTEVAKTQPIATFLKDEIGRLSEIITNVTDDVSKKVLEQSRDFLANQVQLITKEIGGEVATAEIVNTAISDLESILLEMPAGNVRSEVEEIVNSIREKLTGGDLSKSFGSENKLFKKPGKITPGQLNDITILLAQATKTAGFYVEGGIRDFAEFSKRMIQDFGDNILPHLRKLFDDAVTAVDDQKLPTQTGPTSNKERQVDRERAARGLLPIGKPELSSVDEMNETALDNLKEDETLGEFTVSDILNDPNPMIGDRQNALLAMYRRTTMNKRDKWAKRAENGDIDAKREYDKAESELERIDRAAAITRSQWGRWGILQQQMINQDFSRVAMERKARVVKGGPLNQTQIKEIKERSEAIAEEQKSLEKSEEKQKTNVIELEFSEAYKQLQKRVTKRLKAGNRKRLAESGKKDIEDGLKELSGLGFFSNPLADPRTYQAIFKISKGYIKTVSADVQEFVAFIREKTNPEFNESVTDEDLIGVHTDVLMEMDQSAAESVKKKRKKAKQKADQKAVETPVTPAEVVAEIETFKEADDPLDPRLIYKLAEAYILDGVHGEDAVMTAVTKDLQAIYEGITEHDVRLAFTQYGKLTIPSQEAHKIELREIKTLVRLQESIDRLNVGLDPLKTGLQRDQATQKIRERQKVLNILMREHARKNPAMSAEKLASVEQTRVTRLQNRIEDLEKQIRTGEKPLKGVKIDDSPEVIKLKAQIDILKETLEQIELAKNPPISPEQNQINELAELREHLDRILQSRDPAKSQKDFEPLTKKSADLKKEIDELRKAIALMRRNLKDPRTPSEKREATQIKALEKAIDLYDRKLAAGDFSPLYDTKEIPVTARVKALRELRDARRAVYLAANKARRPILTREERINRQRMAALKRREADLKSRIQDKDFSKKEPRKVVQDSAEVAKHRFDLDQEISTYNELLAKFRFDQMGWFKKGMVQFVKTLNLSRAVITAVDLSAALRQGGIVILAHPKLFRKNLMPMLRAFRSRKNAHKIDTEIRGRANAHLYKQSGLFIAEQNTTDVSKMEEVYMSAWAEKIPIIAGSSRAYVTFLNKLRADAFDMMLDTLTADGHTHTKEETDAIANYVNVATGRGKIGTKSLLELKENSQAGEHLATIFFAPKYVASRFNFLFGQPFYNSPRSVQKMIAKEYARYLSGISVVISLAAMAASASRDDDEDERPVISFDPRSSDFLKVRFGDTRIDLMSGLIQPTVFMTRILSGQTKTVRGDVKALRNWMRLQSDDLDKYAGVNYGSRTAFEVFTGFGRSKLAPAPGWLINFMQGSNVVGQQFDPVTDSLAMFAPLSLRDFSEMLEENGVAGAISLQTIVTFGAGAQTYGDGGWSEQQGAIARKIQDIKDEVTAETTPRARRAKFNELQAEHPWLLSGANLDTYKSSVRPSLRKPDAKPHRRGDVKETKAGVKIKDLPEHIKGERTELISDINSAMRKLEKQTKLADLADLADHSATLKKALESGDVDTGMFRGMKIKKELEKSARQIKQENIREIRRAKRAAS